MCGPKCGTVLKNGVYAILYALRTNLSVAIVGMVAVSSTNIEDRSQGCGTLLGSSQNNFTEQRGNRFNWSSSDEGYILGAWFYGFVSTQIIGGILADRFNPTYLFAIGVGLTTALSLLTPISTNWEILQFSYGGLFLLTPFFACTVKIRCHSEH